MNGQAGTVQRDGKEIQKYSHFSSTLNPDGLSFAT